MAFLPFDATRKVMTKGPAPADDWHAQWGGPPMDPGGVYDFRAPGGGSWSTGPDDWQARIAPRMRPTGPLGGTPDASGPGGGDVPFQAGAQPPTMPDWSQYKMGGGAPDWRADLGRGVSQWGQALGQTPAPAPQQGGGFTPLSQLGRGLGRIGGALGLPGLGGGNQQPAAPPTTAPPTMAQQQMVLLRAPNGQTKQVPADQVAHYLARGATRG